MQSLSLLIKPASGNCNMRCDYCFYADVSGARKAGNRGMMTAETLEIVVKKALEEAEIFCSFGFQGGEPALAGLDFYRLLMEFQKKYNIHNTEIFNSIQTNGMLINDKWAEFLSDNKFLTGLSIDADENIHDKFRKLANGKGSHEKCMLAAQKLTAAGADYNILSVITKEFASDPAGVYNFFKKHGFRFVQPIACLDGLHEEHCSNSYSLDTKSYGLFLNKLFDLWYEDFIRGDYYSFRMFDNYVRILMGEPPENCAMKGYCESYPVVEADGKVYPCDFYVIDEFCIGDIHDDSFESMLNSETSKKFMNLSKTVNGNCKQCEYLHICRGGCRRDREQPASEKSSINYYCGAYKSFFSYTLPRMKEIANKMPRRI